MSVKKNFGIATALACAALIVTPLAACGDVGSAPVGKSTLLGQPKTVESLDYSALDGVGYKAFKTGVEAFAADFAASAYSAYDEHDNFAVSPISVYTALALTAECAAGDTRSEILDALGVTHEQLKAHFSTLYRSLEAEHKVEGKVTSVLDLSNSVWVNEGTGVKQSCIDALSNDYYAYSYSADFERNNAEANKAVRDFVKKQTKGLIDKDFELPEETLFTLINTLYLKTIWNTDGRDLSFAETEYEFTAKDGSTKNAQMLQGDYVGGRAAEFDTFTTFYTKTVNGYKIKFIVPKDGYTVDSVFSAENIAAVNSISNYNSYDVATGTEYETRVLFPEYKCKYDDDIINVLKSTFGIDLLFKSRVKYPKACDFSTLSDESCYCEIIRHVTDLTVDKKGIEGAAVTVVGMAADSAPMPTVREDFIVDKAFGFIITDWQDITLFSGVVENV